MINIKITSWAFLIPALALLLSNCNTTNVPKPTTPVEETKQPDVIPIPKTSLDETAANLLLKHRLLNSFPDASQSLDDSQLILISLKTNEAMAGRHKTLDLIYNGTTKKWDGTYEIVQRPIRNLEAETTKHIELSPTTDWLQLITTLDKSNMLTIRNAKEIDYKKVVADGATYTMSVYIDGKSRTYSHANPSLHANAYPEIKDLADFSSIIKTLKEEFINKL